MNEKPDRTETTLDSMSDSTPEKRASFFRDTRGVCV